MTVEAVAPSAGTAAPPRSAGPAAAKAGSPPFSAWLAVSGGAATADHSPGNDADTAIENAADDGVAADDNAAADAASGELPLPADAATPPFLPLAPPPPPATAETPAPTPVAATSDGGGLLQASQTTVNPATADLSPVVPPVMDQPPQGRMPEAGTTPAIPPERPAPGSPDGAPANPPPAHGAIAADSGGDPAGTANGGPGADIGGHAAPDTAPDTAPDMAADPVPEMASPRFQLPAGGAVPGMAPAGGAAADAAALGGATAADGAAHRPQAAYPMPAPDGAELLPDGGIRIEIGGGDRLDIGIGLGDAGAVERVTAGLDHLRHELRAIGAEVEAIRVEVRRERGPDGNLPPQNGNRSAGQPDRESGSGNGGGQPHNWGHDMQDGFTQADDGRARIRTSGHAGQRIDRYA